MPAVDDKLKHLTKKMGNRMKRAKEHVPKLEQESAIKCSCLNSTLFKNHSRKSKNGLWVRFRYFMLNIYIYIYVKY